MKLKFYYINGVWRSFLVNSVTKIYLTKTDFCLVLQNSIGLYCLGPRWKILIFWFLGPPNLIFYHRQASIWVTENLTLSPFRTTVEGQKWVWRVKKGLQGSKRVRRVKNFKTPQNQPEASPRVINGSEGSRRGQKGQKGSEGYLRLNS